MARSGPALCWAGTNTLAVLAGDLAVRCWDLHTGDTYLLSPPDTSNGSIATPQEVCTSLSYCKNNGMKKKTQRKNLYKEFKRAFVQDLQSSESRTYI